MSGKVAQEPSWRTGGFGGRTVLSLESRRSVEIATLIENCGGRSMVAPATREVNSPNPADVSRFVSALLEGRIDLVIFLTGVGTRALVRAVEPLCPRERFLSALSKVPVLARGPKPAAALKELGVPIAWNVPEPNTWKEILWVLDVNEVSVKGRCVAVQEYGAPSKGLLEGLGRRGATVLAVHVYDWALPEDVTPLRNAIKAVVEGRVDIGLFTAAIQVHHFLQVAEEMGASEPLVAALRKMRIASIGPVTSEALSEYGIQVNREPSHPKMGFLVREAAEFAAS
jgi:uroporphyrinogen-III synthase